MPLWRLPVQSDARVLPASTARRNLELSSGPRAPIASAAERESDVVRCELELLGSMAGAVCVFMEFLWESRVREERADWAIGEVMAIDRSREIAQGKLEEGVRP